MKTPFLSGQRIEQMATGVIRDYEAMRGRSLSPPIPVENMIERLFGLGLVIAEIDPLRDNREVLGFIDVRRREIVINKALEENRKTEGRLVFTCAHEVGHWVLHRRLVANTSGAFHRNGAIFCRTRYRKHPLEWQADHFASCLLMPGKVVQEAFQLVFGRHRLELINQKRAFASSPACFDLSADNWPLIADRIRQVGGFVNVSKEAMIHRLQELGLVINRSGRHLGWNIGHRA